jgi:hypothetical protein
MMELTETNMEEVKRGRKEVKEIKYYITKAGL